MAPAICVVTDLPGDQVLVRPPSVAWLVATHVSSPSGGRGEKAGMSTCRLSVSLHFPLPQPHRGTLCRLTILLHCAHCVFHIMVSMFWRVGHHSAILFLSSKGVWESSYPLKAPFLFLPFNFLNYYFEVLSGRSEYKYLCTIWPQFLLTWKVLICFSLITS